MRCKKTHKLMSASLDRELSAREQDLLDAHLKECAVCRKDFHVFQGMHRALLQTERVSAPPGLSPRVMARLDTTPSRPFFVSLWMPVAEALVILMAIGIGVLTGNFFSNSMGLHNHEKGLASMSLEIFDATPPDSLGGAYLAMLEVGQ